MKSLRRQHPHDSLYMLLDTMCNAFGGIILLAVLVTLLSREARQKQESAGSSSARQEQQRDLDAAQMSLQQALDLQASLQARTNSQQIILVTERNELQEKLDRLRDEEKSQAGELDAVSQLDPAQRAKKLNDAQAAAEQKMMNITNRLTQDIQQIHQLKIELAELKRKADERQNEMVRQLRLPKEHETSKEAVHFLVQYGRVYPCDTLDLSAHNETMIRWIVQSDGDEAAEPIPGAGYDVVANAAELQAYFSRLSVGSDFYASFAVAADSFGTYNRLKPLVAQYGLAYGWRPFAPEDLPVTFTSGRGNNPKPQ